MDRLRNRAGAFLLVAIAVGYGWTASGNQRLRAADPSSVALSPAVPAAPGPLVDTVTSPSDLDHGGEFRGGQVRGDGRVNEALVERLRRVEARLRLLEQPASPAAANAPAGCPQCGATTCGGNCWGGFARGVFEEADVELTGFFHLDWGYYDQSPRNQATLGDLEDGLGFRRARLAATGRVAEDIRYIMEFDFAQAQARFVDVWMEFEDTALGNVRIGRFKQPFGMSEQTNIRTLPFLERPLQFALSPFRQTGVMLHDTAWQESATWAVSGYRYASDNYGNVYSDDGGYGLATRLTAVPYAIGDDRVLHVGFDFSYNDPGQDRVQFASPAEFFVGHNPQAPPLNLTPHFLEGVPPFVTTGAIDTDNVSMFNVEAAVSGGRWLAQSEVRWASVEQLDGVHNTFPGAYAHVRYLLTGEQFAYSRSGGAFQGIEPDRPVDGCPGSWGAWELAGRVSLLDLNGHDLPGPGRRLTDLTLGVNWYLNAWVRFQWNYIHSELDDPVLGSSQADLLALRGQLAF